MNLWGVLAASGARVAAPWWASIDWLEVVIAAVVGFLVTGLLSAISKRVRAVVYWVLRQVWQLVRGLGLVMRWFWRSRPVSRRRFDALEQRVSGTMPAPKRGAQRFGAPAPDEALPKWKTTEPLRSESAFPVSDRYAVARGAIEPEKHPWTGRVAEGRTLLYLEQAWPLRNVTVVSVAGSSLPVAETFGDVPGYSVLHVRGDNSGQQIHTVSISWDTDEGWPARAELGVRPA